MPKKIKCSANTSLFLSFLLLIQQFSLISTRLQVESVENSRCLTSESQISCSQCIRSGKECAWMEQGVYQETRTKCFPKQDNQAVPEGAAYPAGIQRSTMSATGKKNTYIEPEETRISLRPGFSTELDIRFKVHKSYPVDIYYLFDVSSSMQNYIKEVMVSANEIITKLKQEIGDDLRIGVGSFVEKPAAPFTSLGGQHVFKNWLKLTDATDENTEIIRRQIDTLVGLSKTMKNNDAEEAGLEAMVQVAACKNEIGWKDIAKHLVVYSTDATMHLAGDGRLAGINRPNDMECYLEAGGKVSNDDLTNTHHEYYNGLNQDYPSVYEVKDLVNKHNIQTIFALTGSGNIPSWISGFYQNLTSIWGQENKVVNTNENKEIADLLVETYLEMTKRVTLNIEGIPDAYEWSVDTTCTNEQGETNTFENQMYCENPQKPKSNEPKDVEKTEVLFKLKLRLKEGHCPEPAQVSINTPGYGGSEKVDLELKSTCSCDGFCKTEYQSLNCPASTNGQQCSGHGKFSCGICVCEPGFSGDCCDCELGNSAQEQLLQDQCSVDGSSRLCSGRGTCQCGKCICDQPSSTSDLSQYFGEHCECTLGSCPMVGSKICNNQGNCECGKCNCNPGWLGEACECSQDSDLCDNNCNDNGECLCNSCKCLKDNYNTWYFSGKTCNSFQVDCDKLSVCKAGSGNSECDELATQNTKGKIPENRSPFVSNCKYTNQGQYCPDNQEIIAQNMTSFYLDGGELFFVFEENYNCSKKVNVAAILFWTIASTLLIGILIIIAIRIIVEWLNYREWKELQIEEQRIGGHSSLKIRQDEISTGF